MTTPEATTLELINSGYLAIGLAGAMGAIIEAMRLYGMWREDRMRKKIEADYNQAVARIHAARGDLE